MFGLQGFQKNYMDPHVLSVIANPDPVVDKKTFQNNLFQGFDSQRASRDLTAPSGSRPECPQNEKSLQNVQWKERELRCHIWTNKSVLHWVNREAAWVWRWAKVLLDGKLVVTGRSVGCRGGENGDGVVESLCRARSMVCSGEASLPPAAIRTTRPAVPQFNCTFVHIWHNLDFMWKCFL